MPGEWTAEERQLADVLGLELNELNRDTVAVLLGTREPEARRQPTDRAHPVAQLLDAAAMGRHLDPASFDGYGLTEEQQAIARKAAADAAEAAAAGRRGVARRIVVDARHALMLGKYRPPAEELSRDDVKRYIAGLPRGIG